MVTYEVRKIHDDGKIYVVVTKEDGTTFGQNVPEHIKSKEDVDEFILSTIERLDKPVVTRTIKIGDVLTAMPKIASSR